MSFAQDLAIPRSSASRVFLLFVFALAIQAVDARDGRPVRDQWRDLLDAMVRRHIRLAPSRLSYGLDRSLGLIM